jgi:hypothetical protein
MKILTVLITIGFVSVGSCWADIGSVTGTGTTAALLLPSNQNTVMDGFAFPTAVISDALSALSSQIVFTYTPPPDYGTPGDRLIIEVINDTGSTLSDIEFTLLGVSAPQYYYAPFGSNPPYQGVPSAGIYSAIPNTYTTTADLSGDLNPGHTALNFPLTLGPGQEQDVYFAVNYVGAPADFTLTQLATAVPEPGFYEVLALGLTSLTGLLFARRIAAR